MEFVRDGSNAVGELLRVCDERVVVAGIAANGPAVVEDHVVVSEIFESVVDDQLCGLQEQGLGDVAAEAVPVVPYFY